MIGCSRSRVSHCVSAYGRLFSVVTNARRSVNKNVMLHNPDSVEPFFEAQDGKAHGDYGENEKRIHIDRHLRYLGTSQHDATYQTDEMRQRQNFGNILCRPWHTFERKHET